VKPAGIPLGICRNCSASGQKVFRIVSPVPAAYIAEDGVQVSLDLDAGPRVQWFVDGAFLPVSEGKQSFAPGTHRVDAVRIEDSASDTVIFTVMLKK
jgi:hypothetical protein